MFARLFRRSPASRPARRTRHLGLESLEGRQLLSLGVEFPITTVARGAEFSPVTASSSNGSSVVVWVNDSSGSGVLDGQRFNAQGQKVGPQMTLAGQGGLNMTQPSVAMDARGDFVVSWTESFAGHATDVMAQKFNPAGLPINGLVPVGVGTFPQSQSSAAMDAQGDFVIAYTRVTNNTTPNVFAKVYNANSQPVAVTSVGGTEYVEDSPSVAMTSNGQFDVAYQFHPNISTVDVYANRFTFNGALLGEYWIASSGRPAQSPSIAMDNHGNAVVAYQQYNGNNWDILARRLSGTGSLGGTITVQATSLNEMTPSVALEENAGAFVVAYQSYSSVNVTEVNASNVVIGTHTAGASRYTPHVSINNQNEYLLAYMVQTSTSENIAGRFGSL